MTDFSLGIEAWAIRTKRDLDRACRAIALELHKRIVLRSPVGNPELWAANAEAALQRSQHNEVVNQIESYLKMDPANLTPTGRIKKKFRSPYNRRLSKAQLAKEYPFRQGQGYVGGRLRGSWSVSIGAPSLVEPGRIDPSGGETIAAAHAALSSFTAGPPIYITSVVPYARRVEYGWSKRQAPEGMVRITAVEFGAIVQETARTPS